MLIFVTGARGAIGRQVVFEARRRGHTVAGLGHGAWAEAGLPPIDHWTGGSIDEDNLDAMARAVGLPDTVVHLAGGSHVGNSVARPAEDFRRTVVGAQHLVEWLRTRSPKTALVLASSAAVYGDGHDAPIPETAPFTPTSPYGAHKSMIEILAACHARQYGMPVAIVRPFSVYGPGLRKQVVWELTRRLIAGERAIGLGGTGAELRDFIHIADAATMLLDAGALADTHARAFNACSGRAIDIATVAKTIASRFDGVSIRFSGDVRPGDPAKLVGDPTRAEAAGLQASTSFEAGMAATVDWIVHDLTETGSVG